MNITSQEVFKIFDYTPKGKELSFGDICRKFSEKTSLQSDPSKPIAIWLKYFSILDKPHGAMAVLVALSATRTHWSCGERYIDIKDHIYNLCRNHMFQGGWYKVAELCTIDFVRIGDIRFLKEVVKDMTPEAFYGNLLPKAYRVIESNLKIRNFHRTPREISKREKYRGIRRKVRRRGYNDKGSLKFPHEWLPGEDYTLNEKEEKLQQFLATVPQMRKPKQKSLRYYFGSSRGVGPNDST